MKTAITTILLLAIPLNMAGAQESSKPWWNPFAPSSGAASTKSSGVQESSFFDSKPTSAFKVPQLSWPSFGASKKPKKGPSPMDKMTQSSKRMWNNTVDFLNPFDSPEPQKQQPWYQPQNMKQEQAKESAWKWPWSQPEKAEEPASVGDFLRRPRPQF